jgi:dTMP kinase
LARGRFITFEGGEGAGKSTQIRRFAEFLSGRGIDALVTREPGGSPGAEAIRTLLVTGDNRRWDPLTETLLHFAARSDHVTRTIEPALEAGRWVVCDRFVDSTIAYQGYGQNVDRTFIDNLSHAILGDLRPDLTVLLDLPVDVGLARAAKRHGNETRYETMDRAFHERIRLGFRDLAVDEPGRFIVIDADADLDTVQRRIETGAEGRLFSAVRR